MTIQELGALGEMIGGIAIILSLIYVGVQIRQNTKATKSATANATIATTTAFYTAIGNNKQSSTLMWNYFVDPNPLSPEEKFQCVMNFHALMLGFQNSYLHKQSTRHHIKSIECPAAHFDETQMQGGAKLVQVTSPGLDGLLLGYREREKVAEFKWR